MFKKYVHAADAVFALVLFFVFALSLLLVLLSGVTAYQKIRDTSENGYSENTCISYISTKVHHGATDDCIYLSVLDGVPAIALDEEIDGAAYVTYIYYYDGYIKEIFTLQGNEFPAESGSNVLPLSSFGFEITQDNLLYVFCTGTGGTSAETYLYLPTGGMTA